MLHRRTTPTGKPEPRILAVLLLTLGLTALLAVLAQQAERSHREAAHATLRDYAAFASWELGRRLEDAMVAPLNRAMSSARVSAEIALTVGPTPEDHASHLASFRAALVQELEMCRCAAAVHDVFVVDLESGRSWRLDGRLPEGFSGWLELDLAARARRLPQNAAGAPPSGSQIRSTRRGGSLPDHDSAAAGGILIRRDGPSLAEPFQVMDPDAFPGSRVLFTVIRDQPGRFSGAYGLVLDTQQYAALVAEGVVEHAEVLPPSLKRGRSNAEMLVVRVLSPGGTELYRTSAASNLTDIVVDTVSTSVVSVTTHVGVRPALAGTLLIGGLPRSRLPLLVALCLITLILVAVGVIQLRRQHELARLRNDFVSGVSHELRTPLTQISMFAELLESGRLDAGRRQRSIRIINEEAQRLRYLVDNVLQFSGAGRTDAHESRVLTDLSALVRDVAEGFALLVASRNSSIRLAVEPGIIARVDPQAIRQVLLNLLDNAAKYGPPGQCLTVTLHRAETAVVLSVEDEGSGIAQADRDEVWKPYRRLSRDVEAGVTGSGIGLALVRELVGLHGGTAHIETAAGGGARFVVTLPGEAVTLAGTDLGAGEASRATEHA